MKVPPNVHESCLCHYGADTFLVVLDVSARIHMHPWELHNSHIFWDAKI